MSAYPSIGHFSGYPTLGAYGQAFQQGAVNEFNVPGSHATGSYPVAANSYGAGALSSSSYVPGYPSAIPAGGYGYGSYSAPGYVHGGYGVSGGYGYGYGFGSGYGEQVTVGEEIVQVPVRVPVVQRVAPPPVIEQVTQIPVPYPVETVVPEVQHVVVQQYVNVPQIQYVEKPVVEYVTKPTIEYVEKPVIEYVEKFVPEIQYVEKKVEKIVHSCYGCGRDFEGQWMEAMGKKWHEECYILCAGCGRWIYRNLFEALGKAWHFGCFTCFKCGECCGNSQWVLHEGKVAHQSCLEVKSGPPGMAMRQTITCNTLAEAERLDAMDGVVDGKYNGTAINCPDPEWQKRWAGVSAWEVSDERMALHLDGSGSGTFDGQTDDGSRIVISSDGAVDGNV
eukprot:NODE_2003_length_1327_cov_192.725352_g1819_i0.p1 GENE.NODE_2003_length_1327_cov_192.725352_g1819_i0~~NODE_2003_length_1327_cov_192.725352_g1819_i0.p1  ORF type:complete len:392 (+),score=64.77 NODE_2003_length_1327_cov_192.725352_g1819_i0:50-1225(+)